MLRRPGIVKPLRKASVMFKESPAGTIEETGNG